MTSQNDVYQGCALVSVIGSLFVVMTLVLFKSMRTKLFMQLITFISIADFIGNIQYATLYRPPAGTFRCTLQGFVHLVSYPSSWLWTAVLVRCLYDLSVLKRLRTSMIAAHLFCWGLPIFFTLMYMAIIPPAKGTYSRHGTSNHAALCTYGGEDFEHIYMWHIFSYYGVFFATVFYMAYMFLEIRKVYSQEVKTFQDSLPADSRCTTSSAVREGTTHTRAMSTSSSHRSSAGTTMTNATTAAITGLKFTSESLLLYPLLMLMWVPHVLSVILAFGIRSEDYALEQFTIVATNLKILHGLATAVLFFWKSPTARIAWYHLLVTRQPFAAKDDGGSGGRYPGYFDETDGGAVGGGEGGGGGGEGGEMGTGSPSEFRPTSMYSDSLYEYDVGDSTATLSPTMQQLKQYVIGGASSIRNSISATAGSARAAGIGTGTGPAAAGIGNMGINPMARAAASANPGNSLTTTLELSTKNVQQLPGKKDAIFAPEALATGDAQL
jgi:hypothetical protein